MMTRLRSLARTANLPLLAFLACLFLTPPAHAGTWNLSGALYTHDPSITQEGGTWWIFETGSNGIGVKYSGDGHAWSQGGSIFGNGLPWWKPYNGNSASTWAGDIHDWNGRAVCFYAVSSFGSQHSAIGLATASSIAAGDWTDQGAVLTSGSGSPYNAIDPNFVVDNAGQPWLAFGSFWDGINIVKLDRNTLRPTGGVSNIASDGAGIEGAYVVSHGGYYYLFASKGTCCNGARSTYHIVYGRSSSITGPYTDKGGRALLNGGGTTLDAGGGRFIVPGGQSIYGGNVIARHELDSSNNYASVLFINDLYWSNGWPTY